MRIRIYPGSMGVALLAMDLLGSERVNPGCWGSPVYVNNVTEEEFEIARELFKEKDIEVVKEK